MKTEIDINQLSLEELKQLYEKEHELFLQYMREDLLEKMKKYSKRLRKIVKEIKRKQEKS
jgi:hypothetical protein